MHEEISSVLGGSTSFPSETDKHIIMIYVLRMISSSCSEL